MTPLRLPFLVIAFSMLSHAACAATAKPVVSTYGTREQLRECLNLDDSLKQRSHAIEASMATNNQMFDASEAEAGKLVEMKKTLDRNDKTAISSFNQLVVDHNLHVQQAHQLEADNDLATKALTTDKAAADQKCGELTYRPGDLDVVNRERKKAAAVAAAGSAP